jgi:hypothetical protein
VSAVVWIEEHAAWVTACDDSTLRMWNADGTPRFRRARAEEKKEGHAGESRGDSRQHAAERERERERERTSGSRRGSGSAGIDGSSLVFTLFFRLVLKYLSLGTKRFRFYVTGTPTMRIGL